MIDAIKRRYEAYAKTSGVSLQKTKWELDDGVLGIMIDTPKGNGVSLAFSMPLLESQPYAKVSNYLDEQWRVAMSVAWEHAGEAA